MGEAADISKRLGRRKWGGRFGGNFEEIWSVLWTECVLSKFICFIFNPIVMVFRGGDFETSLGHEDGALMNRLSALMIKTWDRLFLHDVWIQQEGIYLLIRKMVLIRNEISRHLDFGLLSLQTWEKWISATQSMVFAMAPGANKKKIVTMYTEVPWEQQSFPGLGWMSRKIMRGS